jgi:hypothetical protein
MVYLWHPGAGEAEQPGTASGLREGEAYVRTFEMGHH